MTLLGMNDLGVTLVEPLFSQLNLTVRAGDRLGIAAANGRGKTTLLRVLAGQLEPTTGSVQRARSLKTGFMEQDVPERLLALAFRDALLDALPEEERLYEGWKTDIAMDALEVPEEIRDRPLGKLSGGWQRLALLARLAVSEPDVLLLDEPTNHLDLGKILVLERFLTNLPKASAVVMTSHDRAFLDCATNRTLFLRHPLSVGFSLPYGAARAALEEADAARARKYANDMKTADQLRRQAAKLNNIGINSGSDLLVVKTRQLKARAERLEGEAEAAHKERSAGTIALAGGESHARVLIRLEPLEVTTPDGRLLFKSGPLFVEQGDRIVLLGVNGAGKSRFVERLRTAIASPGSDPALRPTASLKPGYVDQALALLKDRDTPLVTLTARFTLSEIRARSLLSGAGIAIEQQARPLASLSGGQKARLALLMLRLMEPNFFLLDEPTNHLDIDGQDALCEELLREHAAALIISHDRAFVRNVASRFWLIENRRLRDVDDADGFFRSLSA
nr:ABC-F family ATP-binding cassette domain-containing protein [uncultured Gellertiella sp.]